MHRLRPSMLLALLLLSLMGLAATAHAQTPLQASFDSVPDAPEVGQVVTFIDTTKTTLPYARAWDLDGDGKFTDSEQATPSKAFDTPGEHVVSLRVRRTGTNSQESIAHKTITVTAKTAPTATPTPAVTAAPIEAPKINLPPV